MFLHECMSKRRAQGLRAEEPEEIWAAAPAAADGAVSGSCSADRGDRIVDRLISSSSSAEGGESVGGIANIIVESIASHEDENDSSGDCVVLEGYAANRKRSHILMDELDRKNQLAKLRVDNDRCESELKNVDCWRRKPFWFLV